MEIYHIIVKTGLKAKGQNAKAKSDDITRTETYDKNHDEIIHYGSGNMPWWAADYPGQY